MDRTRKVIGQLVYWMYCQFCMDRTDHHLAECGEWEVYTCAGCGNRKQFRVR